MSNACTYAPSTGTDLFYALKKKLGYKKAWEVYGIVTVSYTHLTLPTKA